jgi:hypothetical protein
MRNNKRINRVSEQPEKLPIAPLSEAVRRFSNSEKWREFKALEMPIEETLDKFETMAGALFNGFFGDEEEKAQSNKDMDSLKGYGQKVRPGADARKELQKGIVSKLIDGQLVGYGYFTPRHPNDGKVEIPSDIWTGYPKIKWHVDKVKGQGMEFTHVEVSKAQLTIDEPRQKQGRPSFKPFIEESYKHLRDSGKIDFKAPMSALYGPICNWLAIRYPDDFGKYKNLEDTTIRKAISDQFKVDRSKHT